MSEKMSEDISQKEHLDKIKYLDAKFNVGKYLGEKLNASYNDCTLDFREIIDDPFEAERLNMIESMRENQHRTKMLIGREGEYNYYLAGHIYSNNFSIRPLPKSSYNQDQIVKYVKEFYEPHDFEYDHQFSLLENWARLSFKRVPNQTLFVTLSIFSPVYGKGGKDTKNDELKISMALGELCYKHSSSLKTSWTEGSGNPYCI